MTQCCANCFYQRPRLFVRQGTADQPPVTETAPACCYNFPNTDKTSIGEAPLSTWPRTALDWWCGCWSIDGTPRFQGPPGPQGPAGTSGSPWSYGTDDPSGGNDGDWYIKQIPSQDFHGYIYTKVAGVWTFVISTGTYP